MSETLLHFLLKRKEQNAQDVAIQFKDADKWLRYTWTEYFQLIQAAGAGLQHLGLNKGARVALISDTRPEWAIADFAILGSGGVTVPIYPNNLDEDVAFILNDSEAQILILEDAVQIEKWKRIQTQCPKVKDVIVIDHESESHKSFMAWSELLTKGRQKLQAAPHLFIESAKSINLQDWATLLYTSGTTGRPKGVVLSHTQVMSELHDVFNLVTVTREDISLSFLPYSHVLGRMDAWASVYAGYVLAFAESIDRVRQNLKEIRPTFMIAVPRIFEKIYVGILAQVENSRIKRQIFQRALKIGMQVSEAIQKKKPLGLKLAIEYEAAKNLVFNNVLQALGGRMRFAVSGGAPLSAEIAQFFHGLGLLICEGYGLTETTAAVTFNSPLHYKFGSVGKPLADVEIKIAEDGEILVKSKKVMLEYYNNPEATAEALAGGYFHTGDIGHFDEHGYLHITDRKKDLIKTAGGKYVAPQKLEKLLKQSPYISNVLIHGDQKKYVVALLTINRVLIQDALSPETYRKVKDIVAEANTQLASFESIKKFSILDTEFTVESGELTPSLKIKRRYCDQKYKKEIEELYN